MRSDGTAQRRLTYTAHLDEAEPEWSPNGKEIVFPIFRRTSDDEITLFKSLGIGVEDLAAGELVLQRAEAEDAGTVVSL